MMAHNGNQGFELMLSESQGKRSNQLATVSQKIKAMTAFYNYITRDNYWGVELHNI